ncbi:MATE efflux family protein isoform X2 [Wolffia australiana]
MDMEEALLGDGKGEVVREVERQIRLAGPLIVSSVLQYSLNVISLMFVGHLGELPLAGAAMATSFAGVTGFSLLLGMGSAMDTFCGQAFGAGLDKMLGVYMQRAMIVLTLISVPLALIWAFTGEILSALGQDHAIAMVAGSYARWMIPSLFGYALLQCHVRFLQAQGVVKPMMIGSAATCLIHVIICWALVFHSGLGVRGAAVANVISCWINLAILAVYVMVSEQCERTWTGFSMEALDDVLGYLKLAVPSAVMVCLEFWSFECLVLLSGLLPNPTLETSVLSISLNTSALLFMVPFGLGNAVSTRVSNELGAGRPQAAKLAISVVVFLALMEGTVVALVIVLARHVWGYMYSSEEEVVGYLSKLLPIVAASNFMDAIQCVLSGALDGAYLCAFGTESDAVCNNAANRLGKRSPQEQR